MHKPVVYNIAAVWRGHPHTLFNVRTSPSPPKGRPFPVASYLFSSQAYTSWVELLGHGSSILNCLRSHPSIFQGIHLCWSFTLTSIIVWFSPNIPPQLVVPVVLFCDEAIHPASGIRCRLTQHASCWFLFCFAFRQLVRKYSRKDLHIPRTAICRRSCAYRSTLPSCWSMATLCVYFLDHEVVSQLVSSSPVRHCAQSFTYIILFNPHNMLLR